MGSPGEGPALTPKINFYLRSMLDNLSTRESEKYINLFIFAGIIVKKESTLTHFLPYFLAYIFSISR